jgi:YebC/PmpR family DNA-binding regulatory protein
MVECMTDNRNRTVAEIRHAFSKFGGNLGADGSVAYLFAKVGLFSFPTGTDEEQLMEAAIEAGAEDVLVDDDGSAEVLTAPTDFETVQQGLTAAGFAADIAEVTMRSSVSTELDADGAASMMKLLEMLEDLDDVQEVYSNAGISPEILEQL